MARNNVFAATALRELSVFDGQLVSDDRRALVGTVVDGLEQIGARGCIEAAGAPNIEGEHVGVGEFGQSQFPHAPLPFTTRSTSPGRGTRR